jgi:hypothetical protein
MDNLIPQHVDDKNDMRYSSDVNKVLSEEEQLLII